MYEKRRQLSVEPPKIHEQTLVLCCLQSNQWFSESVMSTGA